MTVKGEGDASREDRVQKYTGFVYVILKNIHDMHYVIE
jgi:hypothetical protein